MVAGEARHSSGAEELRRQAAPVVRHTQRAEAANRSRLVREGRRTEAVDIETEVGREEARRTAGVVHRMEVGLRAAVAVRSLVAGEAGHSRTLGHRKEVAAAVAVDSSPPVPGEVGRKAGILGKTWRKRPEAPRISSQQLASLRPRSVGHFLGCRWEEQRSQEARNQGTVALLAVDAGEGSVLSVLGKSHKLGVSRHQVRDVDGIWSEACQVTGRYVLCPLRLQPRDEVEGWIYTAMRRRSVMAESDNVASSCGAASGASEHRKPIEPNALPRLIMLTFVQDQPT